MNTVTDLVASSTLDGFCPAITTLVLNHLIDGEVWMLFWFFFTDFTIDEDIGSIFFSSTLTTTCLSDVAEERVATFFAYCFIDSSIEVNPSVSTGIVVTDVHTVVGNDIVAKSYTLWMCGVEDSSSTFNIGKTFWKDVTNGDVFQSGVTSVLETDTVTNGFASLGFNLLAPGVGTEDFNFLGNLESWFSSKLSFDVESYITRVLGTTWDFTIHLVVT